MATEVAQLYLQLVLINIEEQILKLQMWKRRRQTFAGVVSTTGRGWERVNLQPGLTNAL